MALVQTAGSSGGCNCKNPPQFIYHRLLLPNFLRKKADWISDNEGRSRLELIIPAGDRIWQSIFRYQIIPKNCLSDDEDITVKIKVGATIPVNNTTNDGALFFGISDKDMVMGMQLNDPSRYTTEGPYRAVEGEWGKYAMSSPTVLSNFISTSANNVTLDQWEFYFKPLEAFGSAFCAADNGHKLMGLYNNELDPSRGLWLEVNRSMTNSTFTLNYIEVEIYRDSAAL